LVEEDVVQSAGKSLCKVGVLWETESDSFGLRTTLPKAVFCVVVVVFVRIFEATEGLYEARSSLQESAPHLGVKFALIRFSTLRYCPQNFALEKLLLQFPITQQGID
jgi:hypothetical protein